ncbi:MAG TPA: hypothetical protein VHZ26_08860 [Caulobacteraceae bacterium]|jgi:hypothetical protein|nr:hypothetical protein [Caulobacteraceae bacterium]
MGTSRLQLRGARMIAAAYLAAPLVAVSAAWLVWYGPFAAPASSAWPIGKGGAWQLMLLVGAPACLAVELVVATPLLLGFSRWRWAWLNGWSACALGFMLAFLPVFALDAAAPAAGDVVDGVVLAAHGARTLAGWISLVNADLPWGLAGLATALVFRLVAVRTAAEPSTAAR